MNSPRTTWRPLGLALPAVALLVLFFLLPMVLLVRVSLYEGGGQSGFGIGGRGFYTPGTWTLETYRHLLGERYFRSVLSFTVYLGLVVTGLTLLIAY
ncbi:MAG: ABC transporter permease, partial [Gemmataceae bacterium]